MTMQRMTEQQIRTAIKVHNPKLAVGLRLHNRGVRKRWTKTIMKQERKFQIAKERLALLEGKK